MPFGLTNARHCHGLNENQKEEHEVHMKLVLESLRKEKLYAKFSKSNVVGDALSIKERVQSRRVRGMILAAQSEAFKQENILAEGLHGLDQQMERKGDETDGQSKRMIQTLEDIMRACVIDFGGSYHLSIRCAPFEALYGRKCRLPVLWAEIGESSLTGLELVQETTDNVVLGKEKPKAARDRQKSYVDYRCKPLEFKVGDLVLLKVTPWKGVVRFGKKREKPLDALPSPLDQRCDHTDCQCGIPCVRALCFFWLAFSVKFPIKVTFDLKRICDFSHIRGSSSAVATEVSALTKVGQEDVALEEAYLELADPNEGTTAVRQSEEEVVTEQPKKVKKKRLLKLADSRLPDREQLDFHSVAPSSQESKGFLDSSAQMNLRIYTTVESSSTLGILIDTTIAAITSTRVVVTNFATDVNPDLAGPSHPKGLEGFDDSFYEPPTLDPSEAKRCGSRCSLAFFAALRTMDYDQLYTEVRSRTEHELELKEKLRAKYAARGSLLEEKDLEILMLKSQLAEKEEEDAEVIRLRDQVSSLFREKSTLTAEVSVLKMTVTQKDHDISLLDSRVACLASTLDDAKVACAEAGHKITSLASERDRIASKVSSLHAGFQDFKEKREIQQAHELFNRVVELEAHVIDVSGHLEGEFYPAYLTTLAGKRWLTTHGIQLAFLKCLKSPKYQGTLGHALGWAVDYGMQEGLEASYEHGTAGRNLSVVDAYNPEAAKASYIDAVKALEDVDFPLVNLLKSKKDVGMDEVLDCFLLDRPLASLPEAAYLQLCIKQLSIPIYHKGDKTAVGETSLSFALMNVYARAAGARKHVVALCQLMMEIVSAPLSSQTWVGEASTYVAPFSVEDYDEEDTDEALGSIVAVPKLETYHF
ncbi:putative reverse transcriptase domain-containing protein [Tanacetum coccineum]